MNEQKRPAVAGPVEPTVRPGLPVIGCVWSGMVWLVSLRSPVKMDLGARLYTEAELDAAVARERGRCAELCDLAESQAEPMPGMSLMNRTIAYCAADTLRKLGYEWDGEAWVTTEPQAEPVRECADNDSPWLICKPCAAVGHCAKLPVAWRSKERINGEFDSGWKLTSNEPPQTPRTIAIEPLYTHPPQQRQPLTKFDVMSALALVPSQLSNLERCIWIAEALNKRAHGIGD